MTEVKNSISTVFIAVVALALTAPLQAGIISGSITDSSDSTTALIIDDVSGLSAVGNNAIEQSALYAFSESSTASYASYFIAYDPEIAGVLNDKFFELIIYCRPDIISRQISTVRRFLLARDD